MNLINDQIGGWTQRVVSKMQEQLQGTTIQTDNRNIIDIFREISGMSKDQLNDIRLEKDQSQEDDIVDRDYIGAFASDDYITKNIRVVPMGGATIGDNQSEHTSKYYASHMGGTVDSDAEEAKHNQEIYHQMLDQRSVIKEMKAEADRKAQEAAEREARKQKNR